MSASPLPREPLSGTCDANGNATLRYRAPAHFYAHAYIAIAVSAGNPSYMVTLGGAVGALNYGQGNQTQLGPILLQPGELVQIIVAGASGNATVAGQVLGWQAPDPTALLPLLPLQPTAVSLTAPGTTVSGTLTNQGDTITILCMGAALVSIQITSGTIVSGTALSVTGAPDGTSFYDVPIYQPQGAGRWLDGLFTSAALSSYGFLLVPASGLAAVRIAMTTKGSGQGALPVILRTAAAAVFAPGIGQQTAAQSQPVVIASDQSAIPTAPVNPTGLPTYWAGTANSSKAIGAGATEQLLAIYHPATVAELLRIRHIQVTVESSTVATVLTILVQRLNGTTAPSGGTNVGILTANAADAALSASDVIQTYPTTKGTVDVSAAAALSWSLAISAAPTDVTKLQPIPLYENLDALNRKPLTIRASTAEGFVISVKSSAASTIVMSTAAEFTSG